MIKIEENKDKLTVLLKQLLSNELFFEIVETWVLDFLKYLIKPKYSV